MYFNIIQGCFAVIFAIAPGRRKDARCPNQVRDAYFLSLWKFHCTIIGIIDPSRIQKGCSPTATNSHVMHCDAISAGLEGFFFQWSGIVDPSRFIERRPGCFTEDLCFRIASDRSYFLSCRNKEILWNVCLEWMFFLPLSRSPVVCR